jgi:hypothetical protein
MPPFYGSGPSTKAKNELGQCKFPVNPQIHKIILWQCCVATCRRQKTTARGRLGFREIADHGVYWDMEWGAATDARTNVA